MNFRWRLGLAIVQLLTLMGASWWATGNPFPLTTWFISGALGVLLALQFSEPFFTRPVDVIVSGASVVLLVLTSGMPVVPVAWWSVLGYAALGLMVSVVANGARSSESDARDVRIGVASFRLIRAFAGKYLYSAVFVVATVSEFWDKPGSLMILGGGWAIVFVSSTVRWDQIILGHPTNSSAFHVVRIDAPLGLTAEGPASGMEDGSQMLVSTKGVAPERAALVRSTPLGNGLEQIALVLERPNALGKLAGKDIRLVVTGDVPGIIGTVAPGTTDSLTQISLVDAAQIGQPLITQTPSGAELLIQVSGLQIESETTRPGVVVERIEATAVQIGVLTAPHTVELSREIAAPGAAVKRFQASPEAVSPPTDDSLLLGDISGTDLPVWLQTSISLKGHMAILGMTGMGKSSFARRLVAELGRVHPVIVVDQTGEYRSLDLPASTESNVSAPGVSLKDLERSGKPHEEALKALQVLEGLGRSEVASGVPATKRVLVLEEAHQFVPEPSMLGFNVPGREESIKFGLLMMQVRKFGVSVVLVSQRTSVVAKSALSQCENIIAFKSVDQTGLDYLESFGGNTARRLLPQLSIGEALALGPSMSIQTPAIIKVRQDLAPSNVPQGEMHALRGAR